MEVIGGNDGDHIQTVTSKIKLHHYFLKVSISEMFNEIYQILNLICAQIGNKIDCGNYFLVRSNM